MTRYFDASAVAKRYIREDASASVDRWLREGPALTARLTMVEVASAAARRAREETLTPAGLRRVLEALDLDARSFTLIELSPEVVVRARRLLLSHPLRSNDAIHLASALEVQEDIGRRIGFVCFDDRLSATARAEGLTVLGN